MRQMFICAFIALAGCAKIMTSTDVNVAPEGVVAESDGPMRPIARPDGLIIAAAPPPTARTPEDFDTTTAQDRAEAAAVEEVVGERALGITIASLGDPAKPGFWLETPLVSTQSEGRIEYQGKSSAVTLLPIDGPATAGSRMSLATMRLIGAPLTGLPEISVFAK